MADVIVHGGGITEAAKVFGGKPSDWLDLSTGINPCPVAVPHVEMSAWHRLPDASLVDAARVAASHFYRCEQTLPLPVPGTQSAIQLLPRLISKGRVAIFSPTYGEYAKAFRAAGFEVDAISEANEITAAHRAVVLVNPNNPTGRVFSRQDVLSLHDRLQQQGTLLIVDEAFGDMHPDYSVAAEASKRQNLIVMRSFGKFFGLAGLRLGFVVALPDVLNLLQDWLGPWAVSGPALSISKQLMSGNQETIRSSILERCTALSSVLTEAGLIVRGGTDLFQLVEDSHATQIHLHLATHQILVRKFDYDTRWLRFGLAPDASQDLRLLAALKSFRRPA